MDYIYRVVGVRYDVVSHVRLGSSIVDHKRYPHVIHCWLIVSGIPFSPTELDVQFEFGSGGFRLSTQN